MVLKRKEKRIFWEPSSPATWKIDFPRYQGKVTCRRLHFPLARSGSARNHFVLFSLSNRRVVDFSFCFGISFISIARQSIFLPVY